MCAALLHSPLPQSYCNVKTQRHVQCPVQQEFISEFSDSVTKELFQVMHVFATESDFWNFPIEQKERTQKQDERGREDIERPLTV